METPDTQHIPSPTSAEEELAWGRRNQNLDELYERLDASGFCLVDENGARVTRATALRSRVTFRLHRYRSPLRMSGRLGFFTHSLIGNALLLLTSEPNVAVPLSNGTRTTFDAILQQPNRHYLANAVPVDLDSVVLIRHGVTAANARGIALGRSDGADDWRGELVKPVDQLSFTLPPGVDAWHCSTLLRTRQTAQLFGVHDARAHGAFDEMDIGAAEGIPESKVIHSFISARLMYHHGDPFAAIVDELHPDHARAAGECFVDVLLRVAQCLTKELGAQ